MLTWADIVYILAGINIILAFVSAAAFVDHSKHIRKYRLACLISLGLAFILTALDSPEISSQPENFIILLISAICTMVLSVAPRFWPKGRW